jgi:hypothetical protein
MDIRRIDEESEERNGHRETIHTDPRSVSEKQQKKEYGDHRRRLDSCDLNRRRQT